MPDYQLEGTARKNFCEDLLKARKASPSSDADFANRELKISLNTYKKCIDPDGAPLKLRRSTLVAIIKSCKFDPARYDLDFAITRPARARDQTPDTKDDLGWLVGTFIQFRRQSADESPIAISTLTFAWDTARGVLTFSETVEAPPGGRTSRRVTYRGDVHMHQNQLIALLSAGNGETRLALVHAPKTSESGPRRLRGIELASGTPNGILRPVISAIYLEDAGSTSLDPASIAAGTLSADHQAFARLTQELHHLEPDLIAHALHKPATRPRRT